MLLSFSTFTTLRQIPTVPVSYSLQAVTGSFSAFFFFNDTCSASTPLIMPELLRVSSTSFRVTITRLCSFNSFSNSAALDAKPLSLPKAIKANNYPFGRHCPLRIATPAALAHRTTAVRHLRHLQAFCLIAYLKVFVTSSPSGADYHGFLY